MNNDCTCIRPSYVTDSFIQNYQCQSADTRKQPNIHVRSRTFNKRKHLKNIPRGQHHLRNSQNAPMKLHDQNKLRNFENAPINVRNTDCAIPRVTPSSAQQTSKDSHQEQSHLHKSHNETTKTHPNMGSVLGKTPDVQNTPDEDVSDEHKQDKACNTTVPECMLPVYIGKTRVPVLIDSGATLCMVGDTLFNLVPELKNQIKPLQNPVIATAINGSSLTYDGCLDLVIRIDENSYKVHALYSPKVAYNVVLGFDFLKSNNINFDFNNQRVIDSDSCRVVASHDIHLPPNSETVVWAALSKQMKEGDCIIGSSPLMPQLDLFVAGAVVTTTTLTTQVPVKIMNPGATSKSIRQKTTIAEIRTLGLGEQLHTMNKEDTDKVMSSTVRDHATTDAPEDFKGMFDLSKSTFSDTEKETLMSLLWNYQDIFAAPGSTLGCTDLMQFEMELKEDAVPFKARPYRSNPLVRKEIKRQVQEMLDKDIIEPSTSQFGSPVLLVTKPDGSYRFCIDYRKLNSMTKIDCHPISRTDDCLESLGASNSKYFTSLDLESGYWQLPVHPDSRPLTAFVTHDGLYQCKRMSFGLVNAPSVFTRLMSLVLQGLSWEICLVYLDDVIVFSSSFEQHVERLRLVFDRFRSAKLTLKPKKCHFGLERIKFLGHFVSKDGIEPMPEKCKAVQEFPTPTKVKDIRSFLGLAGYYRRFIKDFSKIAGPMTELTKTDVPFVWSPACEASFQLLKEKLVSPPILAYPDYNRPYILQTDASGESVGMVLAQVQDDVERVIAYAGKRLAPNERNYSTTEKEALAVIYGLKQFDPYLRGNHVTIVTDHSALTWLLSQKEPKGRICRWIAYLQQFNFTVVHKSGVKHTNADSLSRRSYAEEENNGPVVTDEEILPPLEESLEVEEHVNVSRNKRSKTPRSRKMSKRRLKQLERPVFKYPDINWSTDRIQECQADDADLKDLIAYLKSGQLPPDDSTARDIVLSADQYVMEDGVLYRLLDNKSMKTSRQIDDIHVCLVVPKELKYDTLASVHGDLGAGHYGTSRTYTTLRLKFFWKGMYHDCKNWVLSCETCNTRKTPVRPTKAELQPLPPVMTSERWAMDIVKLPKTPRKNSHLLTFTEYNTRYVEAFPIKDTSAKTIARVLVDEICFRYGAPQHLLSDLGANLISKVVSETCELLGISRLFTSPYRPQTDGLLEKFHGTMCKNLSMYVNEYHDNWDELIRGVCHGYNTSACTESTQFSPFFLMFGREPLDPIDTVLIPNKTFHPDVKETIVKLQAARSVAKENLAEKQRRMKEQYDKNIFPRSFEPGDMVWINFPEIVVGGSKKFYHNWSGPYVIIEKCTKNDAKQNFRVAHAHNGKELKNVVHVNRMKPFHHRTIVPPKPEVFLEGAATDIDDLHPRDADSFIQSINAKPTNTKTQFKFPLLPTIPETLPGQIEVQTRIPDEVQHGTLTDLEQPILLDETVVKTEPRRDSLLPPLTEVGEDEYEINKIVKARYNKSGEKEYLIDWKGYPASARTYEPYENLNAPAREYVDTHDIMTTGRKPEKAPEIEIEPVESTQDKE